MHDVMDNKQQVFFVFEAFVEKLFVRHDHPFCYDEAWQSSFKGLTFFEDTNIYHVLEFFLKAFSCTHGKGYVQWCMGSEAESRSM